jgi:hypothetical protein
MTQPAPAGLDQPNNDPNACRRLRCPKCGSTRLREFGNTSYSHDFTGNIGDGYDDLNWGNRQDYIEGDEVGGIECANCQSNWATLAVLNEALAASLSTGGH